MKGEKLMKTASQIKKDLISLYGDYEKKRIYRSEIFDYVRDVYYLESTGMIYEDWLEEDEEND